jgi:hypothetical protein
MNGMSLEERTCAVEIIYRGYCCNLCGAAFANRNNTEINFYSFNCRGK